MISKSGANDNNEYVPSDEENNGKKSIFITGIHIYFLVSIEPRGKQTSSD